MCNTAPNRNAADLLAYLLMSSMKDMVMWVQQLWIWIACSTCYSGSVHLCDLERVSMWYDVRHCDYFYCMLRHQWCYTIVHALCTCLIGLKPVPILTVLYVCRPTANIALKALHRHSTSYILCGKHLPLHVQSSIQSLEHSSRSCIAVQISKRTELLNTLLNWLLQMHFLGIRFLGKQSAKCAFL